MYRYFTCFFSILVLAWLTACAAPPDDLDLALTHATAEKHFVVTLQSPVTPAAINQIHSWQLRVSSPTGVALNNLRIAVDGGMPQHGHGYPTRPAVTVLPLPSDAILTPCASAGIMPGASAT